jgi:hypothetical protein
MANALGLAWNFAVGLMAFAKEGTDDLTYPKSLASRNGILYGCSGDRPKSRF